MLPGDVPRMRGEIMTKKQRKYLEKKDRKKTIFLVISGVLGGGSPGGMAGIH